MFDKLTATCHCKAVRLDLPADVLGIMACHCGDCQKMHGNFNAFLAAPCDAIQVDGEAFLVWYQSSEGSRRAFCGTCGARVLPTHQMRIRVRLRLTLKNQIRDGYLRSRSIW